MNAHGVSRTVYPRGVDSPSITGAFAVVAISTKASTQLLEASELPLKMLTLHWYTRVCDNKTKTIRTYTDNTKERDGQFEISALLNVFRGMMRENGSTYPPPVWRC